MPEQDVQVHFQVSLNGVDFDEGYHLFTYYKPYSCESLRPNNGPSYGGTELEILGVNFTTKARSDETKCVFRATSIKMPDKLI